jgi:hypothetical protein
LQEASVEGQSAMGGLALKLFCERKLQWSK